MTLYKQETALDHGLKIGDRVTRKFPGKYDQPDTGSIVEIGPDGRIRVFWDNAKKRTWFAHNRLLLAGESAPQKQSVQAPGTI